MVEGIQRHEGDMQALLSAHVVGSGMNAPKNVDIAKVHPFPDLYLRNRPAAPKAHISILKSMISSRKTGSRKKDRKHERRSKGN